MTISDFFRFGDAVVLWSKDADTILRDTSARIVVVKGDVSELRTISVPKRAGADYLVSCQTSGGGIRWGDERGPILNPGDCCVVGYADDRWWISGKIGDIPYKNGTVRFEKYPLLLDEDDTQIIIPMPLHGACHVKLDLSGIKDANGNYEYAFLKCDVVQYGGKRSLSPAQTNIGCTIGFENQSIKISKAEGGVSLVGTYEIEFFDDNIS